MIRQYTLHGQGGFQADRPGTAVGVDRLLLFSVAGLLGLGMVMVFSTTVVSGTQSLAVSSEAILRHWMHICVGGVLLTAIANVPIAWLQKASKPVLLTGFLLLISVLFPGIGREVNGSLRWIDLGILRIQPSEFVKLAAIIYFADYLARKRDDLHLFKVGIINTGMVLGMIGLLLLLQPDFGTVVVIFATASAMMFLAGVRLWHCLISAAVAVVLMAFIMWMEPYRMARLLSYRDPWGDPFGTGFQLVQALIAIGRGEWFGVGLGSSIQKLFYLPHASTDFLLAIIGEELGATGIFSVLVLFMLFLFRAFSISRRALRLGERFAGFVAQGIGVLIPLQAAVHIGVNTGLLPTKGLTLPMMSYGGSSMVSCLIAVGILLAIDRQCQLRAIGEARSRGSGQ